MAVSNVSKPFSVSESTKPIPRLGMGFDNQVRLAHKGTTKKKRTFVPGTVASPEAITTFLYDDQLVLSIAIRLTIRLVIFILSLELRLLIY